jgi:hypothetical protein
MSAPERLFTARFALMFGFSFTVFLSAFQLLPTAPFHILALGGSQSEAGPLPRPAHLCLGHLGAAHRRNRRPHRQAAHPAGLRAGHRGLLSALYAMVPPRSV